jgi:outer membrane protein
MKNLFYVLFLLAGTAIAQTGYVQYDALLQSLPEFETAQKELAKLEAALGADLQKAKQNATQKFNDLKYKSQNPDLNEEQMKDLAAQAETLEKELARESKIAEFKLVSERNKLMEPINLKVSNAVKKIAESKAFQLVIDAGQVVYTVDGLDITKEVAIELGIPLNQETAKN